MLNKFWMLITTLEDRIDQWFVGAGTTATKAMEKAQYVMRWSGGVKEKIIIFDRF